MIKKMSLKKWDYKYITHHVWHTILPSYAIEHLLTYNKSKVFLLCFKLYCILNFMHHAFI